jgi:hypothetical protein
MMTIGETLAAVADAYEIVVDDEDIINVNKQLIEHVNTMLCGKYFKAAEVVGSMKIDVGVLRTLAEDEQALTDFKRLLSAMFKYCKKSCKNHLQTATIMFIHQVKGIEFKSE